MTIPITDIPDGSVAGRWAEQRLKGQGGLPSGEQIRNVILLGERLSTGDLAANKLGGPYSSDTDIASDAGAGSVLDCMGRKFMQFDHPELGRPNADVYIATLDEDASNTQAVQTATFGGTNATKAGTWKLGIGGHLLQVTFAKDATPAQQAAAMVAAYGKLDWGTERPPLTMEVNGGTSEQVDIKGCVKGDQFNNIGLRTLTGGDPGVGTTLAWSGSTMGDETGTGTAGVGSQDTNMDTLLDLLQPFGDAGTMVVPYGDDATLEELIDHANLKSNGLNMIPTYLISGKVSALATLKSHATGLDSNDAERVVCGGLSNSDTWNGQIAVDIAAALAAERHLARSLDEVLFYDVHIPDQDYLYNYEDLDAAQEAGVSAFWKAPGDKYLSLNRLLMVRSEWGAKDFNHIQVADYTRMSIMAEVKARLRRVSIKLDGEEIPEVEFITTPKAIAALIYGVLKALETKGYLKQVDSLWLKYKRELVSGELRVLTPTAMVDQFHRFLLLQDVIV